MSFEDDVDPAAYDEQSDNDLGNVGDGSETADMPPPISFADMPPPISFADMPPPIPFSEMPEAEGKLAGGMREFAHGIIPGIAALPGMVVGAAGGAAVGGPAAPVTGFLGAIGGGMLAAGVAANVQERALKAIGFDDSAQRAANAAENPISTGVGGVLGNSVGFSPGRLTDSLVKRVLGGATMAAIDVGQQYGEKGEVDPTQLAISTAGGLVFNRQNRFGAKVSGATERLLPGGGVELPPAPTAEEDRTNAARSEPTKTGIGNAQAQPKPSENVTGVGNEASAPVRSERDYEKRRNRAVPEQEGNTELAPGEVAPDIAAALQKEPPTPVAPEPTGAPAAGPTGHVGQPEPPRGQPEPPPFQTMPEPPPRQLPPVAEQHAFDVAAAEREGMQRAQETPRKGQLGEAFAEPAEPGAVTERGPAKPAELPAAPEARREPRILEDLTQRQPEQAPIDRAIELARQQHLENANETTHNVLAVLTKARENPKLAELVAKRYLAEYTRQEGAKARATPDISEPKPAPETHTTPVSEGRSVTSPGGYAPSGKKASGAYPVNDASGRTVGHAKSEALARTRSNMLKIAKDVMDRHTFPETDPTNREQVKALREKAKAALADAEENGYRSYLPREKKLTETGEQKPHLEAPPHALWMAEVKAFATGKRNASDFVAREKLLRSGDEQSVDIVREDRLTEGDLRHRRTPEVTSEGNLAPTKSRQEPFGKREPSAPVAEGPDGKLQGHVYDEEAGHAVAYPVERSMRLGEALRGDDYKSSPFYEDLTKRMAAGEPNQRVHWASDDTMRQITDKTWGKAEALPHGFYDPITGDIFLRGKTADAETLLHESVHANVDRKLLVDADLRGQVRKIMDLTKDHYEFEALPEQYRRLALDNEREFVAYGLTQPAVQRALGRVRLSPEVAKEMGLPEWRGATAWQAFVKAIQHALGLGDNRFSALEALVKVTENAMERPLTTKERAKFELAAMGEWPAKPSRQQIERDTEGLIKQVRGPTTIKMWNGHTIAQHADQYGKDFGGHVRTIFDQVERGAVRAHDLINKDNELTAKLVKLSDKYAGPVWDEFENRMHQSSSTRIWPDAPLNQQGKRDRATKAWGDAQHADMENWFNRLPTDLKDVFGAYHNTVADRQEKISAKAQENILQKLEGIADRDLIKRVLTDNMTTQDELAITPDTAAAIKNAMVANDKPYLPQSRRGGWAVLGQYKVDAPTSPAALRKLPDRTRPTYEFNDKAEADGYAGQQTGEARVSDGYYVDKTTGERFYEVTDPVTGTKKQIAYTKDDAASDPNLEKRWNVSVQDRHLEFLDKQHEATARERVLHQSGELVPDSTDVQPRRYVPDSGAETLASQLGFSAEKQLRNNELYQSMNETQRAAVRQILNEQHIELVGATRTHNARLRRENVRGFSSDMIRGFVDYSQRTAHQQARLEIDPAINEARAKAETLTNKDRSLSNARRKVLNETDRRTEGWLNDNYNLARASYGPAMHRLLNVSAAARLLTPGFWIRNATQPGTHSAPMLDAEFGALKGTRMLLKVARDIGWARNIGSGFAEMGRSMKGNYDKPATLLSDMKARLRDPFDHEALDYAAATKTIDPDAAMQIDKLVRTGEGVKLDIGRGESKVRTAAEKALTAGDHVLEWMENVSRGVTGAVEANNRAMTFLAAARLEYARNGGDKEGAFRVAKDFTDNSQVRYTETDKPLWQRHPLMRLPFQFKEFGKAQYALFGRSIMRSIKNAEPGDRAKGLLTLGGLAATHMIVAGVLGLPTEPARMMLLAARAMGITDKEWDDVEHYVRNLTSGALGKKGGDALAKGLPHLLNIDLSGGLGLDNLLFFASPRSGTDRDFDNNLMAWMAQSLIGAPGTFAIQAFHGMRDIMNGDPLKGMQQLIPIRAVQDVIRAGRQYAEGKHTARGRETSEPYTAAEAISRAAGLPVARESNEGAAKSYFYMNRGREQAQRSALISTWITADTPAAKDAARQKALAAGITGAQLVQAQARERAADKRTVNGIVTTKGTRESAESLNRIYNLGRD